MVSIKNIFWSAEENRLRAGWRVLLQLVINIGLYFLLLWVGSKLTIIQNDSIWASVIMAVGALVVTCFSVWLGARFLDQRAIADLGLDLRQKMWWADFGFGVLVGVIIPAGFVIFAHLVGWIELEVSLSSGADGIPFALALILAIPVYLAIGTFEEVARVYHLRNLFEGTWTLGVSIAMVLALSGGAAISVLMHEGNTYFLLYIFIATFFHGLAYFLTERAALAMAHHAAWDFTMIVIFGFGVAIDSGSPTIFQTTLPPVVSATNFTLPIFLIILLSDLISLGMVLGWVRWRYGSINLSKQLTQRFWQYMPRKS